jgi:hypothetical protein
MGSTVSALSPMQSAELSRQMRREYENCLSKNMSESEMQTHMSTFYNTTLQNITANPLQMLTHNTKKMNRGISKDISETTTTRKPIMTRRRSFGEKDTITKTTSRPRETKIIIKKPSIENSENLSTSSSAPALEAKEEQGIDMF